MDQPGLDRRRHETALQGLGRLNRISRSAAAVREALADMIPADGRPLRVLDAATGGGDVPLSLARWARRHGIGLVVDGCDISQAALDHARRAATRSGAAAMRLFRLDVLREDPPAGYDAIVFSLFLHHLTDDQCVDVLGRYGHATRRLVVNDLRRNRLTLRMVRAAAKVVTRSDVVHTDAALSVRAAFTAEELGKLAERAGFAHAAARPSFPARLIMKIDCR
ncbi:MAG: methyltransferase domain-containing protein [Alphaproteobacteria bacterium]|jgi:2-polyprenyl-3-methyl-5-hydroxy-6-metoxy-1,4-benzoquinol methylase|nr:methyltransferase domain-containing protein [Alphaproteobacteria bacterium]